MRKESKVESFSHKTYALISVICPKCNKYQGCYSRDGSLQVRECIKCGTEIELEYTKSTNNKDVDPVDTEQEYTESTNNKVLPSVFRKKQAKESAN